MSFETILSELNHHQKIAAMHGDSHALVLAGAGCGKTKTIIARAAYLISQGTPAERIQILTFTRKSASEIVERVRLALGEASQGLRASTFHTWCISMIRSAPRVFGLSNFTVIDRDDQLQLFKVLRGKQEKGQLPTAAEICDLYSYARNTRKSLSSALEKKAPNFLEKKEKIAQIMRAYQIKKKEYKYFDYDDILDMIARGMSQHPELKQWIGSKYDHILVDEMQDTNPLQWAILEPLSHHAMLFCVGDDAQSIYGFRGADFKNVHTFDARIQNSHILRLEQNYRSTQEILDLSNWLLSQSPISYNKQLKAVRGSGIRPKLHTFDNEWEEGRWIAEDLSSRRQEGAEWSSHLILVRSSYSARSVENALIHKNIPYKFIGGTKLLESAHVRDLLSALRVIGNNQDEIAWMRYLTLWPRVGEATASKAISQFIQQEDHFYSFSLLKKSKIFCGQPVDTLEQMVNSDLSISDKIKAAAKQMEKILSEKYKGQDWEKRKKDFKVVAQLADRHTSVVEFLEAYLLDPVYNSTVDKLENSDVVSVVTIHSAKGMECDVCYVQNVSAGSYPSAYAINDADDIEEERRVLYVALTRAKNELILTRKNNITWVKNSNTEPDEIGQKVLDNYFLNPVTKKLLDQKKHKSSYMSAFSGPPQKKFEINLDLDMN